MLIRSRAIFAPATAASWTDVPSKCAACGREDGDGGLKLCAACNLVKYCCASCQRKHRPAHEEDCKVRAAELREEALFQTPPPPDDCPVCFLPHSVEFVQGFHTQHYKTCCGKTVCYGCQFTMAQMSSSREKHVCAFCREPCVQTAKEDIERGKERMALGDADALDWMADMYQAGVGVPRNHEKAVELRRRAVKLGSAEALFSLGNCYQEGEGVSMDKEKERHYLELAAMKGHTSARHNLGCYEITEGDLNKAMRHFVIAARSGHKGSLSAVCEGFRSRDVTKQDFEETLRAFQQSANESKSKQRDEAAAHLKERMNS